MDMDTPETDMMTHDTLPPERLPVRLWGRFLDFLTMRVPMWALGVGAIVFVLVAFAIKAQVADVDRRQREADARDLAIVAYSAELRAYDLQVRNRVDCLASVARSDANRGQHEAMVTAFQNLKMLPGASETLSTYVDSIVADLQAGPLLSTPPRQVTECPPEPLQPPVPEELGGGA